MTPDEAIANIMELISSNRPSTLHPDEQAILQREIDRLKRGEGVRISSRWELEDEAIRRGMERYGRGDRGQPA